MPKKTKEDTKDNKDEIIRKLSERLDKLERQGTEEERAKEHFGAVVGPQGVQGTVQKYRTDKGFYPDPTGKLYDLPELKRYALKENYRFTWDVDELVYENAGVQYSEPKFTVELWQIPSESDKLEIKKQGKNPETAKIHLQTGIFLEDKNYAERLARQLGVVDEFTSVQDMLDEIRQYRVSQWLLDYFKPRTVEEHEEDKDMVIGGRVLKVKDTEAEVGSRVAREAGL